MILAIDIGNSRLKWALADGGAILRSGAGPWRDGGIAPLLDAAIGTDPAPARIVASSVAGSAAAEQLDAWSRARNARAAEMLQVSGAACGVRNGYLRPRELGVDRWLGAIAAWNLVGGPACVVDCGTATTVNVLGADGEFRGGIIAPGFNLMQRALASNTAQLFAPGYTPPQWPARTTADAISAGSLNAVAGGIERALRALRAEAGAGLKLLLTGGESELLAPHLDPAFRRVPDLVLRGVLVSAGMPVPLP
ncbi:MAG: type III pantothenate kinase [Gammaproteobacteria bacterium]